jgi:hypothetical protein
MASAGRVTTLITFEGIVRIVHALTGLGQEAPCSITFIELQSYVRCSRFARNTSSTDSPSGQSMYKIALLGPANKRRLCFSACCHVPKHGIFCIVRSTPEGALQSSRQSLNGLCLVRVTRSLNDCCSSKPDRMYMICIVAILTAARH